jgi:hypothetical protein
MKYKDLNAKQRAYLAGRCKHNMIREFCATCNKFEYLDDIKFPMFKVDEDTGLKKLKGFGRTTVKRVGYKTWR